MKKVSVIVPVYNVEKYLRKCLDSLVNQTLKSIEIIVVNDGTKDNSQDIIDEYVKKYPKIIRSYIKENGGLSSARNYGVKYATGQYIGFVDSDDFVDLDLFEKMYNKAIDEKSNVVGCQVRYIYKDKISIKEMNPNTFNKSVLQSPNILLEIKSYAPNKIFKREFWINNNFQFPIQYYEDSALIYNVLLASNKVSLVSDSCYNYNRKNESSITRIADDRAYDIFKSCDSILNYYKEKGCYDKIKEQVDYICIKHIRFRIRTYISAYEPKKLKKYIEYSNKYLNEKIPGWKKNYINSLKNNNTFHNKLYCIIFKNNVILNVYVFLQRIKHLFKNKR